VQDTGLVLNPFPGFPVWLVLALGGAAAFLSVVSYRRTTRPVGRQLKRALLLLRLLAVALVAAVLLRPSLDLVEKTPVRRPLIVLRDRSRSMTQLRDTPTGATRWEQVERLFETNRRLLKELEEQYELLTMDFARGVLGQEGEAARDADRFSAYGLAMQEALRRAPKGQIEAVIILGDGSHNYGRSDPADIAARLNERRVPIYAVGLGRDTATSRLLDIKVAEVTAPKSTFRRTLVPVRVRLLCRGLNNREITVWLKIPALSDEPVQSKKVAVIYTEEIVPVEFEVRLDKVGEYELIAGVDPLEGELLPSNNTAKTWTKVKESGVLVGYLDSVRPESKFVGRALLGTENVSLSRALVLPGRSVPGDVQDELASNDVTILGDLRAGAIKPSSLFALVEGVQQEGHGLIVLLTERSGGPQGWRGTPVEDLLPVRLTGAVRVDAAERRFVVDPRYVDHPALALGQDVYASQQIWTGLPTLSGAIVGAQPKRGAQVLARDESGSPLLVAQRSGKGLVACLLADTTFRWTFSESDTQQHHARFWRQLVAWASGKEPVVELNVTLRPSNPALGEEVHATVKLTDNSGQAIRHAETTLEILGPDGRTERLVPSFSETEAAYVAAYEPRLAGDYAVVARAGRGDEDFGEDSSHFSATDVDRELEDPVANHQLLRRLTAATAHVGGRYYDYAQADELFRTLRDRAKPVMLTRSRRRDVWDLWPLFALLCACLMTEWSLRKWKGLV